MTIDDTNMHYSSGRQAQSRELMEHKIISEARMWHCRTSRNKHEGGLWLDALMPASGTVRHMLERSTMLDGSSRTLGLGLMATDLRVCHQPVLQAVLSCGQSQLHLVGRIHRQTHQCPGLAI
jgi:hypothetical protein